MCPPSVLLLLLLLLPSLAFSQAEPEPVRRDAKSRVKDIARVQGADANYLEGVGLVVGLPGTGDSPKELSQKLEAAWLLHRIKLEITPKDLQNKNAAIVSVSAELPAFQQPGTYIDIHVASIGDAKSLRGGHLNLTALYSAKSYMESDEIYVRAQGELQLDGGAGGNPTTAVIPRGGWVKQAAPCTIFERSGSTNYFTLTLLRPDWNVAGAVSDKVRGLALGGGSESIAQVLDPGRVRVEVPRSYTRSAEEFVALVLGQEILLGTPEEPDAAVVINERAGTYAVTGYVTVNPGTVQKGNVVVRIPYQDFNPPANANARPLKNQNAAKTVYLNEVLENLGAVGFSTADIIDLLKQMDRAGMINGSVRSE